MWRIFVDFHAHEKLLFYDGKYGTYAITIYKQITHMRNKSFTLTEILTSYTMEMHPCGTIFFSLFRLMYRIYSLLVGLLSLSIFLSVYHSYALEIHL